MDRDREARPLRVALFTDTFAPQLNGVARTLQRWQAALQARGHTTLVFTTSADGVAETESVRRCPSVPFWAYKELRLAPPVWVRAAEELEAFAPDIIHVATPFGVGLVGRANAHRLGVPLVTSYHTNFVQYARYYGLGALTEPGVSYLRWFHSGGRKTFVPTRAIARELEESGFRELSIWSRGVDGNRFHPRYRDPALRETIGVADGGVLVSYVGRLAPEKGADVAIQSMREVMRRREGTLFAAAGDGPDEQRCRQMAPAGAWFAGRLTGDPLSAFYASSDIFVFPSTTDTFGNVLAEAMASGLAIVAADVPQSREVIGEHAGVFAEPGNPASFADAITALVDDRSLLDAKRRCAIARAQSMGWPSVFDRLLSDYRSAIAS